MLPCKNCDFEDINGLIHCKNIKIKKLEFKGGPKQKDIYDDLLYISYLKGTTDVNKDFDDVDKPQHYTRGRRFQPAWCINDWGLSWDLGTCVKYLSRLGRKDENKKDIKKAFWYLVHEIALHYKDISKNELINTINYIYEEEEKYGKIKKKE